MVRIEAAVGAVSAVTVVGLPGGVGGLEQDVGAARVVTHDEVDVARARFAQRDAKPPVAEGTVGVRHRLGAGSGWGERMVGAPGGGLRLRILANEARDVDSGDRVLRRRPGRRHGPVPAVVETRRGIAQALGLGLGERHRRRDGVDEARPESCVPAHAVDVDPVVRGVCLDLEEDGLAEVDADVVAEALDARVAPAIHVPLGRGGVRELVLFNDAIARHGHPAKQESVPDHYRLATDSRAPIQS